MPSIVVAQDHVVAREAISELLSEYTLKSGYVFAPQPLTLQLKESGEIIGGIAGSTNWDWLYIELLAIELRYRGQGYAKDLVISAEEMAQERGCVGSWVDTFTFQAPEFYRKLGYEQFGELPNYPGKESRLFLRKLF